jgi:tRNA threonylcarbamoyladenosine biosynthesis protein TsaB
MVCSVGLSANGNLIALREDAGERYAHAEHLHEYISEVLGQAGLSMDEVDAIAVSRGPGSYTGLRIGVSAAKGLAFAKGIPILSVCPLQSLAMHYLQRTYLHPEPVGSGVVLLPMIDARRMEVYVAAFDAHGEPLFPVRAEVITPESFPELKSAKAVHCMGDGAHKVASVSAMAATFKHISGLGASVSGMVVLAHKQYAAGVFEDLASFEPFYLKDFIGGRPKAAYGL